MIWDKLAPGRRSCKGEEDDEQRAGQAHCSIITACHRGT